MADIIHDHYGLRADQIGWTHQIEMRWFHDPTGDHLNQPDSHHLLMSIDDAEDLIVSLQQAIRLTRARQLDDARRGQCNTCQGTRMVSEEVNGRMVQAHHRCTDCPPADVWEGPPPPPFRADLKAHDGD